MAPFSASAASSNVPGRVSAPGPSGEPNLRPRIAIPEPSSNREYSQRTFGAYSEAIEHSGGLPVRIPLDLAPATMAQAIGDCAAVLLPGSGADVDPEKYGQARILACHDKDGPREAADELLLQDAFNLRKPILGICYGMQSLNVWLNGTLIQDLAIQDLASLKDARRKTEPLINHQKSEHFVEIAADSGLGRILRDAGEPSTDAANKAGDSNGDGRPLRIKVNSSHHQAVGEVVDRVRPVAWSAGVERGGHGRDRGIRIIEAIEAKSGLDGGQFVIGVQWHPERSFDVSSASRLLFAAFVQAAVRWRRRPIRDSVVS